MTQWEYTHFIVKTILIGYPGPNANMAEIGRTGWELVCAIPCGDDTRFVFKRPIHSKE